MKVRAVEAVVVVVGSLLLHLVAHLVKAFFQFLGVRSAERPGQLGPLPAPLCRKEFQDGLLQVARTQDLALLLHLRGDRAILDARPLRVVLLLLPFVFVQLHLPLALLMRLRVVADDAHGARLRIVAVGARLDHRSVLVGHLLRVAALAGTIFFVRDLRGASVSQNRERNHPSPSFLETMRVDGVKGRRERTFKNCPPIDSTCSWTTGRTSYPSTTAPMFFAVWMAASPATPAPTISTSRFDCTSEAEITTTRPNACDFGTRSWDQI